MKPKRILALLALVLLGGCGTVSNLQGDRTPYGGVSKAVGDGSRAIANAGQGRCIPPAFSYTRAACSFGIDAPLSTVGDTLTLPLTTITFRQSDTAQGEEIDVAVHVEREQVVFEIPHRGINGLLSFRVQDEAGNMMWDLDLSYEKGNQIIYGELPRRGNREARQNTPPANSRPPAVRGKTVTVSVEYQYDKWWAACGSTYQKTLRVPQ